jgi:hypothetical protein
MERTSLTPISLSHFCEIANFVLPFAQQVVKVPTKTFFDVEKYIVQP